MIQAQFKSTDSTKRVATTNFESITNGSVTFDHDFSHHHDKRTGDTWIGIVLRKDNIFISEEIFDMIIEKFHMKGRISLASMQNVPTDEVDEMVVITIR